MKILILGDVMGLQEEKAINKKLPNIIKNTKLILLLLMVKMLLMMEEG